jgi:polysaccharide export outer membrane protein
MSIELWRKTATALFLALASAAPGPAQAADDPPQELVVYIREAQRRGVTEAKIRQQAQTIGWSSVLIDKALGHESAMAAKAGPARTPGATVGGIALASDDYQIGPADTLQITVWKEPDVSVPSVVVRPDGKITVPLIKDIQVTGLTPRQVEVLVTDGLSKFIAEPNVTVVLAAINSKRIYVIGAVKKEGALAYNYGMTVMQALSEAGGLTEYARRRKIYILRSDNGREYRLDFNYEEVVRGERAEQNVILQPGDTVVIPH